MFEFIRRHQKIMQWMLILVVFPPFALYGISGFNGFLKGGKDTVAEVAGKDLSPADWEDAQRRQIDLVRQRQPNIDAKQFETKAFRQHVMDSLVQQRVLVHAVDDQRMVIPDARLAALFAQDENYAYLRDADGRVNRSVLAAQGISEAVLEQQLRQEYAVRQVLAGVTDTTPALDRVSALALRAFTQSREIRVAQFHPQAYVGQVQVSDAQLKQYYSDPAHAQDIRIPDEVSLQYLVLDMDTVKSRVTVSDEDEKKYYEQNKSRYTTPEERHVRHILIKVAPDAAAQAQSAARERAQKLLDAVRKNPGSFADVARQSSEDDGSKASGGDLDFIQRGAMVKPFEDAAFALSEGAISDLVRTNFGFHIIQVTEIHKEQLKPLDSVKAQVDAEIRDQLASQAFAKAADQFGNALEQSDALADAGRELQLTVQTADHVVRHPAQLATAGQPATDPLHSDKFLQVVFDPGNLKSPHNTDPIEIAPNRLVAARVTHYTPARTMTFDEARPMLADKVRFAQALALARQAGQAQLAAAKTPAGVTAPLGAAVEISRQQTHDLPLPLVQAALEIKASGLPAWQGVDLGNDGYALVEVLQVKQSAMTDAQAQGGRVEYARLWGAAEGMAYLDSLKQRYKAEVTPFGQHLIDKEEQNAP